VQRKINARKRTNVQVAKKPNKDYHFCIVFTRKKVVNIHGLFVFISDKG